MKTDKLKTRKMFKNFELFFSFFKDRIDEKHRDAVKPVNYIINLFAGPGAGKSTTAAGLFHLLKLKSIKTELVMEFAKDVVYESGDAILDNQFYVTANQHHRIWRILQYWKQKNVSNGFIVTDSPIPLGLMYLKETATADQFKKFVIDEFNQFHNINIFIERVKEHDPVGRVQTKDEAQEIDTQIKQFLEENRVPHYSVTGDKDAPENIYQIIKNKIKD